MHIPVIEDAAEGFGSRWKGQVLGTFGKYGVLSFNGNKMITTSGGGALITNNEDQWREIMMYATQYRESYPYYQHEKIELRHVVDWALSLKQLTEAEAAKVHEVKGTATWSRFADTLTAISLHRLGLPKEWFPAKEVERAEAVAAEEEQRVWDDIIGGSHTHHGRNKGHRRLIIARRTLQNRWKFATYADMSAERFLWKEFVGFAFNS